MPGKKLLVADDSLTIQKVIRLALTNEGYEIQTVPDGTDAVQQISLFRPDVVLIDVSLPGKSAFEVKREINQLDDLEEVRFILMSSAFEKVDEAQVEEVKFHGRLTKPFDPAHLRKVLTDGLEQVTARRMEKTAFTTRPGAELSVAPPPPPPGPPTFFPGNTEGVSIFPPLTAISSVPTPPAFSVPPPPPLAPPSFAPPSFEPPSDELQDSWQEGIRPIDSGSLNPTPPEDVASLWDAGEELRSELIPPPPLPPSQAQAKAKPTPTAHDTHGGLEHIPNATGEGESDIKSLTESTIRSTGLDDYQWSVNEPTLKPFPGMTELDGSSFQIEPSSGANESASSSIIPPFRPEAAEAMGGPGFDIPSEMRSASLIPPPREGSRPPSAPSTSSTRATPPSSNVVEGLSAEQIEALVKDQVHALLEKMAQQLLPDIAEKIIKDEIHKMLSEPS